MILDFFSRYAFNIFVFWELISTSSAFSIFSLRKSYNFFLSIISSIEIIAISSWSPKDSILWGYFRICLFIFLSGLFLSLLSFLTLLFFGGKSSSSSSSSSFLCSFSSFGSSFLSSLACSFLSSSSLACSFWSSSSLACSFWLSSLTCSLWLSSLTCSLWLSLFAGSFWLSLFAGSFWLSLFAGVFSLI